MVLKKATTCPNQAGERDHGQPHNIPDSRQNTEDKLWVNTGTGQLKGVALIWEQASEAKKTRTRGHKFFLGSSYNILEFIKV